MTELITTITIQELLAFHHMAGIHVIGGWHARTNEVKRIIVVSACSKEVTITAGDLVVLTQTCSRDELHTLLWSGACGVIYLGTENWLTPLLLPEADLTLPIVLIRDLGKLELSMSMTFLCHLKQGCSLDKFLTNSFASALESVKLELINFLDIVRQYVANPVFLVDPVFEPLSGSHDKVIPLMYRHFRVMCKETSTRRELFSATFATPECDSITYHVLPLVLDGQCQGYLVVWQQSTIWTKTDQCFIKAVGQLMLRELVYCQQAKEVECRYLDAFVYDLLYNNFESREVLIERGKFWGWDFTRPHHLLIVAIDHAGRSYDDSGLLKVAQKIVRVYSLHGLVSEQQHQIVIIVPNEIPTQEQIGKQNSINLAKAVKKELLDKFPDKGVAIGIGKSYQSTNDLHRSYQEAKTALELGKFLQQANPVVHFEDLGIMRLLATISYEQLYDYYKEYLGALEEYDIANAANLSGTLDAYFEHNGDLNATAEKLYLHPNSLRYRIKKIEEILNADLQNMEYRLNLFAACQIRKIRHSNLWR